jgi:ligand-binding SRPBCC domain-containing protein
VLAGGSFHEFSAEASMSTSATEPAILFLPAAGQGRTVLQTELWLPASRDDVFEFFSDARQLEGLTPGWLKFRVLTPSPIVMRRGALIDYRLKLRGLPLAWQSEIEDWQPPQGFVDVQRRGPYRYWRHEHTFVEGDGGTWCGDRVEYAVPGGRLVDRSLVRPDLVRIFRFRQSQLRARFGRGDGG